MTIADQLRKECAVETLESSLHKVLTYIIQDAKTNNRNTWTCGIWECGETMPNLDNSVWTFMCSECFVPEVREFFTSHGFRVGRNIGGFNRRDNLVISL